MKKRQIVYKFISFVIVGSFMLCSLTGCTKQGVSDGLLSIKAMLKDMYKAAVEIANYEEQKTPEVPVKEVALPSDITDTYTTVVSDELYGFKTLSDEQQVVYNELLACVLGHAESCKVSTLDAEVLEHVYKVLQCDHGELFWIKGYEYKTTMLGDEIIKIEFMPAYTMSVLEQENIEKQIDEIADLWLQDLPQTASDYEKTKYVFDVLVDKVSYDPLAPNNQNLISVFIGRATVCQGFAEATQYLLRRVGIEATIVTGKAAGGDHAWNLVNISGNYYYTDTTWGNGQHDTDGVIEESKNYTYLNMTSQDISQTHEANDVLELPECNLMNDNYFYREGLYFRTFDKAAIGGVFKRAYESGEYGIVKFETDSLYQETLNYFIKEQHLADYCAGITTIIYSEQEPAKTLVIKFGGEQNDLQ